MAATLGFFLLNARLPWNRRARVFLGDSGSVFLGMLLAWPEYLMFYSYIAFSLYYYHTMTRCWRDHRFLGRDVATNMI